MEVEENSQPDSPKEVRVQFNSETDDSSRQISLETGDENPEGHGTRSSSLDLEKHETEGDSSIKSNLEDSFEYPESESARNKLISEALQKEDEFLEYLMSLPAVAGGVKEKTETQSQPPALMRSTSTYASSNVKVGLDHLDNLCKLMEQLGDLREQNSKLQRRVQYLEDLKNLQEMHKQLQNEEKQNYQEEGTSVKQKHRHCSVNSGDKHSKRTKENGNFSSVIVPKREGFEENNKSLQSSSNNKRNAKCKSASNSKIRQSLLRYQQRERSRSVGIDELKADTEFHREDGNSTLGKRRHRQAKHPQRRSVAGMTSANKAKVSKWTKVKEAFRWEKAAAAEAQDVPAVGEDVRYLRVPSLSGDGDSSSACSSGHSPLGEFSLPMTGALSSSSSSSEDFDIDLNFADILAEFGPQRSASATDSTGGRLIVQDARRLSLSQMQEEEDASRRSKSLDGDATINRHYSGKDGKGKAHKTPWGKVKDIIQTRKDSLKKRHQEEDAEPPPLTEHDDSEQPPPADSASKVKPHIEVSSESPAKDSSKRQLSKISASSLGGADSKASRRLTPMLTLTLPSNEELRSLPGGSTAGPSTKPPPSPQTEERVHKSCPEEAAALRPDAYRRQTSIPKPTSSSAGTSPPAHRRASKWTKVKKAFLTSSPGRREEDGSGLVSCSVPSSPNRNSSFFYEVDPDEVDSGDAEDGTSVQAEIQRNYEELQHKLSQEFHKKLHEWERMKSAVPPPGGSGDEAYPHHDKGFRRKMEEWERIKAHGKNRESLDDNLTPDFRKKLQEWEKMKKDPPEPPHFKKRIAEWQLWRSKEPAEECQRRAHDWERARTVSDSAQQDGAERSGKTPSPGIARKDSSGAGSRKGQGRGKSPEHALNGKDKAELAKAPHKAKIQKEKELQWLEKELQKIEREKQRLEREREKYLEREARLEKMRLAMGSGPRKQEVLIQTSTGFFRFQGISEKFTKRLYEWEKARGIRPEASTFALLDPGYKPPAVTDTEDGAETVGLTRSKSASSVTNMSGGGTSSATITHQPSSLSLNDVEVLGQVEATPIEESRAASEPHLHASSGGGDDEPAAVIVDVEDVIEETAAPLVATPAVESQTPVYCYAPEEVTRLIDSSGSESDVGGQVQRTDSVRTEASYKLLEENMGLLSRLRSQEDICRKIENEIEHLEGKIEVAAKTHEKELERLRQEEKDLKQQSTEPEERGMEAVSRLRTGIRELERRQERLRREGATLQDSFAQHSERQAALAQNLVGNMKQLQAQGDAVALVNHLSSELLTLSERLEEALTYRSREIHNLRFELRRELSQSCGSLVEGARLPRQSSEELSKLPAQLTAKVLELKRGLACLCDTGAAEEEPTATFVLRVSSGRDRAPEVVQVDSEGNTSPVTCVTIVPAFWQRKREEVDDAERSGAANRDSYCSVASSAASSEEHYEYSDEDANASDDDAKDVNASQSTVRQTKKRDSDMDDSADDTDHDESDDENEKMHYSPDASVNKNKEQNSNEDLLDGTAIASADKETNAYETEVLPTKPNVTTGRVKKLLKTRRVSDTHVGYSCKEDKSGTDLHPQGEINYMEENSDDEAIRQLSDNSKRSPKSKLAEGRRNLKLNVDMNRSNENVIVQTMQQIPIQNQNCEKRQYHTETTPSSNEPENLYLSSKPNVDDSNDSAIPSNVFVKTTRKIFSPVRRDSKGKASSVISYVVGESSPKPEKFGGFRSTYSPVSNSRWRQRERGDNEEVEDGAVGVFASAVPPAWMLHRSRSQSSSPAMSRRRETTPKDNGEPGITKSISDVLNESTDTSSASQDESRSSGGKPLSRQPMVKVRPDVRRDSSSEKSGSDKMDGSGPASPGFPPLPQSPGPGRRDLFKAAAKEAAPSIRMMIAKYNQKLTEQEGAGGRSPEVGGSGSGSPVAWRSPVAERRVRAQTEKYQEEVRRVLQHKAEARAALGTGEVQKSASAGVIRDPVAPSSPRVTEEDKVEEQINKDTITNKPPSVNQRRGILKSSSAGSIKPVSSVPLQTPTLGKMPEDGAKTSILPPPEPFQDSLPIKTWSDSKPPSPRLAVSPAPSNPSSPEMGMKHSSPAQSRLRALKLKRAKEEFLTRGPGGQSWTSEDTPSASVSPEPFEDGVNFSSSRDNSSRLSQISVGSESSFDGSMVINKDQIRSDDERMLLVKSASAGMINVDPHTYRRFSAERSLPTAGGSLPRSMGEPNNSGATTPKSQQSSKFGISSITSKFRKVKMRRNKDKEASRMNTVSTLCRQSLLVDIHLSKSDAAKQDVATSSTSSKSCPSSPVLQRTPPRAKPEDMSTSWIRNPARKIFKPK